MSGDATASDEHDHGVQCLKCLAADGILWQVDPRAENGTREKCWCVFLERDRAPCSLACVVTNGEHHTAESLRKAAEAEITSPAAEREAGR